MIFVVCKRLWASSAAPLWGRKPIGGAARAAPPEDAAPQGNLFTL